MMIEVIVIENQVDLGNENQSLAYWTEIFDNEYDAQGYINEVQFQNDMFNDSHEREYTVHTTILAIPFPDHFPTERLTVTEIDL